MASDAPLRIALVAPDCNKRDGQARYVAETAEHLARRGHAVDVLSVGFADTDPTRVHHQQLRAPANAVRARFFAMLVDASRKLRRQRFDIVHAVGASCLHPDVVTFQFCQAAWAEVVARDLPTQLAGDPIDAAARRLIAAIEARVARPSGARRVIAVSPTTADEVRRHCGRDDVDVIPNGVDLARFDPARRAAAARVRAGLGIPPGRFCAAFLGEFERKNLATVIRALAQPAARAVMLVAAGRSDPSPFQRLAADLGVADRVVFAPPTAEPENFLAAADAFVFPTLYEPFGMVALEAAACATPVVVSARAGFAAWLSDGDNGLLVADPFDATAIANCLGHLTDPDRARRIGAAGRVLALEFGWRELVGRTEQIYREVIAARLAAK